MHILEYIQDETYFSSRARNHKMDLIKAIGQFDYNPRALLNTQRWKGKTLLHLAMHHNFLNSVLSLLVKGVNLNIQDDNGITPLMQGIDNYSSSSVNQLLNYSAPLQLERLNLELQDAKKLNSFDYAIDAILNASDEKESRKAKDIFTSLCEKYPHFIQLETLDIKNALLSNERNKKTNIVFSKDKEDIDATLADERTELSKSLATLQIRTASTLSKMKSRLLALKTNNKIPQEQLQFMEQEFNKLQEALRTVWGKNENLILYSSNSQNSDSNKSPSSLKLNSSTALAVNDSSNAAPIKIKSKL